jgi:hypothetical protein
VRRARRTPVDIHLGIHIMHCRMHHTNRRGKVGGRVSSKVMRMRSSGRRCEPIHRRGSGGSVQTPAWAVHLFVHGVVSSERGHRGCRPMDAGMRYRRHRHPYTDMGGSSGRRRWSAHVCQRTERTNWTNRARGSNTANWASRSGGTLSALRVKPTRETPVQRCVSPSIR